MVEGMSVEYYYHTTKRENVTVWFCKEEPMKTLVDEIRDMVTE